MTNHREVFSKLQNWLKQRVQVVLDESDSHKSTIRFMILFEKTIKSSIVVDPSRVVFNLPLFCPDRAGIGSRGSILCYCTPSNLKGRVLNLKNSLNLTGNFGSILGECSNEIRNLTRYCLAFRVLRRLLRLSSAFWSGLDCFCLLSDFHQVSQQL